MSPTLLSTYFAFFFPLILLIVLPFFASFLLDGIVMLVRGRGPKVLIMAAGTSIAIGVIAYVSWKFCVSTANSNATVATFAEAMRGNIRMLVPWAGALAFVAFLARTVKNAGSRRGSRL